MKLDLDHNPVVKFIIIVFLGLIIGAILGEVIGVLLPNGTVKEVFTKSADFSFPSNVTLNLIVVTLTFGLHFNLNLISLIGLLIAIYLFKGL